MSKILLVGCGRMGGALLQGWLARGIAASEIAVIEPHMAAPIPTGVLRVESDSQLPDGFDPEIILLAVKPQVMAQAIPALARHKAAAFLSIAAGKTLNWLDQQLGGGRAIVRAMPNTPAAIGRGMTVAVANPRITAGQRALCHTLLEAGGEVSWVDEESLIDAVTAVSGSGPAYVFLLAEAMAQAGISAGLPAELAQKLARATVAGSGELLHRAPESPAALREAVTSPGGTTFAALQILMGEDGLAQLMTRAVAAATARSRELAA